MTSKPAELVALRARAQALETSIAEQKGMFERGMIDVGTYARLSTDFQRQRIEILMTLKHAVAGTDNRIDDVLDGAIAGDADRDEMSAKLQQVAEERGVGAQIIDKIRNNRGTIITWAIDLAMAIGKQVG